MWTSLRTGAHESVLELCFVEDIVSGIFLAPLLVPTLTFHCRIGVERCRAPGAPDMQLPFTCPLDHVLKPTQFDDELREYGPRVDYREYSFLDNPLLPKSMQASKFQVTIYI